MSSLDLFSLHWEDILIPHVLPYLAAKDLLMLRAVSKNGEDLVQSFLITNRRLDLTSSIYSRFSERAYQIIASSSTNIRHLNLRGGSLRWLQDTLVIPTLLTNPHLSHLDLSSCHGLTESVIFALATADCTRSLKTLKLSSCGWAGQEAMTTLFNATSALEDVDLTGCWGCGQVSVSAALVLNNPRLKRLSLANIYGLRDDSVETLARHAKHLETLDVRECYRLTNGSIFTLLEYTPTLKSLMVRGCRDVSEASLRRIVAKGIEIDMQPPRDFTSNIARDLTANLDRHLNLQI